MDPLTAFVISIVGASVFSDAKRHRGGVLLEKRPWSLRGDMGFSTGWTSMMGRHVRWWIDPGEAVWIDAKYLRPVGGNIFEGAKLGRIASAVRGASRDDPVDFYAPYGHVRLIDEELVRESQEYAAYDPGEPFTLADIGQWRAVVRDGNHRAFGSVLGGEVRVPIRIYDADVQEIKAAIRRGDVSDEDRALLDKMVADTGQLPW